MCSVAQVLRVIPDEEKVFLTLLQEDAPVILKLVRVSWLYIVRLFYSMIEQGYLEGRSPPPTPR